MVVIGLKKRDTFEEVVEYIKHPKDVIKFPDRYAKQIRNSFELSQLDGVGMMEHEEHELQTMKETEKANALRKVARNADDTSHVELKAHTQQSRPPVNTSTTTQTDTTYHKIYTDDEITEQVGKLKSQHRAEASKLIEEAEVEHKVLENRHKQKISNLVSQHSNDIADLNRFHESKHHTAQATLQREMDMKSQSQQQMYEHQARLQEQRHQAEMAKQKKKFESQLREERRPVVEEPSEKRQTTRSMAETVQQNYTEGGGQGSTDVPMATAPPNPNLTDRMSDDNNQQKRNTSQESEATKKQKTARGDEAVPAPNPAPKEGQADSKPNTKVKPNPAFNKPKVDNRKPDNATTQKVEGKSKSWWAKQNITYIKEQAQLRGKKFSDLETKGSKNSKRFKKQDYLNELYKLLGV